MATIDPSIALGVKPMQLDNPMNAMAMYSQIQGAQQANQLNQMKMAEYERARGEEEGVRNALARGDIKLDTPEGRASLLKYGKTGLEYGKALTEQQKSVIDRQTAEAKLVADRTKQSQAALDYVHTPEQYLVWHEANHADPILGPALAASGVTAETSRANIMKQLNTPGGFEKLINQSKLGAAEFVKRSTMTAAEKAADQRARDQLAQNAQAVTYQQDADENIVALPSKLKAGETPKARIVVATGAPAAGGSPRVPVNNLAQPNAQVIPGMTSVLDQRAPTAPITPQAPQAGTPLKGTRKEAPENFVKTDMQLSNLAGSLKAFKDEVSANPTTGAKWLPTGSDTARMQAKYTSLLMGVKDLYTLGALAGPDMSVIESQLTNPASWSGKFTTKKGFEEQVQVLEDMLKRSATTLENSYSRTPKATKEALKALPSASATNPLGLPGR